MPCYLYVFLGPLHRSLGHYRRSYLFLHLLLSSLLTSVWLHIEGCRYSRFLSGTRGGVEAFVATFDHRHIFFYPAAHGPLLSYVYDYYLVACSST